MAQSVNMNFCVEAELKNMETICGEMGLSMTTAYTIFTKTVIRDR